MRLLESIIGIGTMLYADIIRGGNNEFIQPALRDFHNSSTVVHSTILW